MPASDFDVNIGKKIQEARTRVGISQQVLADRISSTQTAMSHYESGRRSVPLETLIEIARELRKPLSYFLGVHDEIMVIKGTTLYEIAKAIEEHPEDLDLLKQLWDYVRSQRGR